MAINAMRADAPVVFGYGTGSTVTQGTSRTTAVTCDAYCGQITLYSAAGSGTHAAFTVNNTKVGAEDVIVAHVKSGTDPRIVVVTAVADGSFQLSTATLSGTTTETPVISFAVIKLDVA
jgi:hypothetical protein